MGSLIHVLKSSPTAYVIGQYGFEVCLAPDHFFEETSNPCSATDDQSTSSRVGESARDMKTVLGRHIAR